MNDSTGMREVLFELNFGPRSVCVKDHSADVEEVHHDKATSDPGSVGSPLAGVVVDVKVKEGDAVKRGDALFVMSAMKMETIVSAPIDGKVSRLAVKLNDSLSQNDLLCEISST